jgi:hypothetical protein
VSWTRALADWPAEARILCDERWTSPAGVSGRRIVDRAALVDLCGGVDLAAELPVRQAFTLVVAWGSGMSNTRSYRNLPAALADPGCYPTLASSARSCRDGDLTAAYAGFSLPGVTRGFATKWFALAGRTPGRGWQPLILDRRVLASLTRTLGVQASAFTASRRWADRYPAYVHAIHAWSRALGDCSAERLEWILFAHGGRPLP